MSDISKCEPPDDLAKVDGWHWVQLPFVAVPTPIAWMVNPANFEREWRMPSSLAFVSGESKTARTWRYLCPALTPAEADALRNEAKKWLWETLKQKEDADALRAERDKARHAEANMAALCQSAEDDNAALRARVAVLERLLTRIAADALNCGCNPCRGDCTSDAAKAIALDAIRDDARAALSTGSETPAGARGEP